MKKFLFSGCLFFSLAALSSTIISSPKLYSESSAVTAKKAAIQKQIDALKDEQDQAELLARFADREAYRGMPIDWVGYRRYLEIEDHAKARAERASLERQQLEKELETLSK